MSNWEEQVFDHYLGDALACGLIADARLDSITDAIARASGSSIAYRAALRWHARVLEQMLETARLDPPALLLDVLSDDLLEHVAVCAGPRDAFWIRITCKRLLPLATACSPKTICGALCSLQRVIWALDPAVWCGLDDWLRRHDRDLCLSGCAARYGDLAVVKYIVDESGYNDHLHWELTMSQAVRRGDLSIFEFLMQRGCFWEATGNSHECCLTAAFHGHRSILDRLASDTILRLDFMAEEFMLLALLDAEIEQDYGEPELCPQAAAGGHLQLLQHLRDSDCKWGRTCMAAARRGHLDVLRYAMDNGCPLYDPNAQIQESLLVAATESNNLELVQWLLGQGFLDPTSRVEGVGMAMFNAARNGNLAMIQALDTAGCPWDWRMCGEAARAAVSPSAHLELIQWLKPRAAAHDGVRLEPGTWMLMATGNNNMPLTLWLRAEGFGWEGREWVYAASRGHREMLEWLHSNGCPWGGRSRPYSVTLDSDLDSVSCLAMLKCLRSLGKPFDNDTWVWAFIRKDMQILKWLLLEECPWGERSYLDGDLPDEILLWARQTARCPWPVRPKY